MVSQYESEAMITSHWAKTNNQSQDQKELEPAAAPPPGMRAALRVGSFAARLRVGSSAPPLNLRRYRSTYFSGASMMAPPKQSAPR